MSTLVKTNSKAQSSRIPVWTRLLVGTLVTVAILLGLNAWIESAGFLNNNSYQEGIIIDCGLAIILAVSLNLVNGFTGQFSLGHIGFYMIGAYLAAALATYGHYKFFSQLPVDHTFLPISTLHSALPILGICLASGLAAALAGFFVGLPSLRLKGDYLAIITVGFSQIILVVIRNIDAVKGKTSFIGINAPGDVFISTPHLTSFFWVYLCVAIVVWVSYSIRFSNHGLAFLTVRDDEVAAEAMGINTTRIKVLAFVLSAFFTGVAGALYALYQTSLSNDAFTFQRGIDSVVMVVLGGLGSISGVSIAAVLLTVVPEVLRAIEQYRLVVYPLLLIILMLARPQGIFGREELSWTWIKGQVMIVLRPIVRLLSRIRTRS